MDRIENEVQRGKAANAFLELKRCSQQVNLRALGLIDTAEKIEEGMDDLFAKMKDYDERRYTENQRLNAR